LFKFRVLGNVVLLQVDEVVHGAHVLVAQRAQLGKVGIQGEAVLQSSIFTAKPRSAIIFVGREYQIGF
jgi:hypothetical protein